MTIDENRSKRREDQRKKSANEQEPVMTLYGSSAEYQVNRHLPDAESGERNSERNDDE